MNGKLWIEKIFDCCSSKKIPQFICSLLFMVVPLFLLFFPFVRYRLNILSEFSFRMWFGLIIGTIWIWLGPLFIYKYLKVYRKFVNIMYKKNMHNDKFLNYSNTLLHKLCKFDCLSIGWIILINTLIIKDMGYLKRYGTFGFDDIYFYIFNISLSLILYFTSVGFKGVINTIKLINYISKSNDLFIDFYNYDGSGGLSPIKELALKTSELFATGVLFMPILLDYIYYTKNISVKISLYLIIMLYALLIFLSFFLPVTKIYKVAEEKKNQYLEEINREYKKLHKKNTESNKHLNTAAELKELNLYNHLYYIKNLSIYSVTKDSIFNILSSSLIAPCLGVILNSNDIIFIIKILFEK